MDIEYELIASFVFENKDDPDNGRYRIHKEAKSEILVEIERKLRRKPLIGMKQPTPAGAMLGWEGAIAIKNKGQIADGYRWKLYCENTLIQEGRTDEHGEDSLDIELSSIKNHEYKLEVFAQINKEDDSGNKLLEKSNEPDPQSSSTTSIRKPQSTL
jgi:hypothetical protein